MTAPELKPCPFCGVEASEFKDRGHSTAYNVGCFNGDCTIEPNTWADTKAEAIAAWNTRADLSQSAIAAALMRAYKEGWSDGAANCHHDRNETSHEGWLISDTYKSIPTDVSASRTHFEQERADHG